MRIVLAIFATLILGSAVMAGQTGTRAMSGQFNVATPDGWVGRRYVDGGEVFAEEFDSNGDSRIDVWRFYRKGVLSSEERDLKGDGKVNYQSRWDAKTLTLVSVFRDTNRAGVNDLEIEALGRNRWEIREDRNRDGVADRILIAQGPSDLFEILGMNLAYQEDVVDSIPKEYWFELQSDDYYTCAITEYRRYQDGAMTHYGQWDGSKVAWRLAGPDYVPPAAPPLELRAAAEQPYDAGTDGTERFMSDPYGDEYADRYVDSARAAETDPFSDPYGDPYAPGEQDVYTAPSGRFRGPTDRTRYEGLPPGDSAARSLPARMRPPGVGR